MGNVTNLIIILQLLVITGIKIQYNIRSINKYSRKKHESHICFPHIDMEPTGTAYYNDNYTLV